MLRFAQNIVFVRVNGCHGAEKSRFACATVSAIASLAWNPFQTASALELRLRSDFYVYVSTLCFAGLHVLKVFSALELLHRS